MQSGLWRALPLLFICSATAFAQVSLRDGDRVQDDAARVLRHATNRAETVLLSEDFANGIPSNWIHTGTANGVANAAARFEYRGIATTPSNAVGSRGLYAGTALPIASATASNGFIIFDSDYLDNLGISGNLGNGPAPAPHLVTLGPPMMNLSNEPNVVVRFTNYYRRRQGTSSLLTTVSATYLDFSTDGGQTWPHSVQLNTHIGNNQSTTANYQIEVNASQFIGGQDSAMFRLRFDGRYYYWQVDDIEVSVPQYNRVKFTPYQGAPAVDVLYDSKSRYGHMSYHEQRPLTFDANIFNFGVHPQTNAYFAVDVRNKATGNVVASAYSDTVATLAPGDTLSYLDLNTYARPIASLPMAAADYEFVFRAVTDSTVEYFDTLTYRITEQRMALDYSSFDNSLGTNSLGLDGAGMAVRIDLSKFEPSANIAQRLLGVDVGLSSLTTGGSMEVAVYDTSAWQSYTAGFDQNGLLAYATDSITAGDRAAQSKYFSFSGLPLQAKAVYVAVSMYSNNGQYEVRLKNDQSVRQTGLSKMMYNANDARWYSGYSNSLTFNAPWIRVDVCPNTPGACGLGAEEAALPRLQLAPNPGAEGFASPEDGFLEVVGLRGEVLVRQAVLRGEWLDASALPQGMYLVRMNGRTARWLKL